MSTKDASATRDSSSRPAATREDDGSEPAEADSVAAADAESTAAPAPEPASTPEADDAPDPASEAEAEAEDERESDQRVAKGTVALRAHPGLWGAQVKVGSKVITVPEDLIVTKKITPGRKKVHWRFRPSTGWTSSASIEVHPGQKTKLLLTRTGPRHE